MYLEHYGLREPPFSVACDARFFYESPRHGEALARMLYTIRQRRGMVLVTGEIGAGKTFLADVLASRLGADCQTLWLKHPADTARQLVRTVNRMIGLKGHAGADRLLLLEELEGYLLGQQHRGRLVALVMDEAQDLGDDALEELRLLWNLEHGGQRLLQIVLMGQSELRDRIHTPQWAALEQRIVMSYHLGPLTEAETAAYVLHRRRVAKVPGCRLKFTPNAMTLIYRSTGGIPRLISILCDNALLAGYAQGRHTINSAVIQKVLDDAIQLAPRQRLSAAQALELASRRMRPMTN